MKTTTIKKKKNDEVLSGKVPTFGTGHTPHRGGGGKHHDRRMKRMKTRSKINTRAIEE